MKKTKQKRPMLRLFIFNGILLLVVFTFLEWAIQQKAEFQPVLQGEMQRMQVLPQRKDLEDFTFRQIGFAPSSPRKLSHFKNNWLLVNFWATWCAPCIKELPSLETLQERYAGQGLRVIAIAMDDGLTETELQAFLNKHNLNGLVPQYWDGTDARLSRRFTFRGYPTTWVIDPYGRHVATFEGDADWASEDAFAFVESVLEPHNADARDLENDTEPESDMN